MIMNADMMTTYYIVTGSDVDSSVSPHCNGLYWAN